MFNKDGYGENALSEPAVRSTQPAPENHEVQLSPDTAFPPAPTKTPKKRGGALKIIALCLCCALIGGMFGGLAVGLYYPAGAPASKTVETSGTASVFDVVGNENSVKSKLANNSSPTLSVIYDAVTPSVVGIAVEGAATNVFGQQSHTASSGTGFVVSSDGYILTNSHVVDGANTITVRINGGKNYEAKVIGNDPQTDVAVIKIEAKGLTPVAFGDSDKLKVGNTVLAIGNPLGEFVNTLTVGVVSALDRVLNIDGTPLNMLQTDAAINPGNSGGPLLNLSGEVVAITTAKSSGSGVEGIGFAIPINDVVKTMQLLIENGYVKGRIMLGVSVYEVTEDMSGYSGIPVGVYVSGVNPGSCAEKAGVQKGDVITAIGDTAVGTTNELFAAKRLFSAGQTSTIAVLRDGKTLSLKITFDEETQESATEVPQTGSNTQGGQSSDSGAPFDFGNIQDYIPGFGS